MRAVVQDRYGPPSVLRMADVAVPTPRPGQVLVRVLATSLNLSDWEGLVGSPAYARFAGPRKGRSVVLGSDIAGTVAAVGPGVERFRVGDEVFGDNLALKGGFAEYAVAAESALLPKPPELSFVQASAIPQAGAIAEHGMSGLRRGDRVLINGAGGGTGMFAIQLAKAAGATVTGVDNAGKLDFMRALGADRVIDFRAEDPTLAGPYDRVLDLVAYRPTSAWRRALARGGRYRMVGGSMSALFRSITVGAATAAVTGRNMGVLMVRGGPDGFGPIADRVAAGELRVHIERTFTLDEVPLALAHVGEGRALGKVVIEVA